MSHTLIIYGTADGHTVKIAQEIANTFAAEGWRTTVVNAKDARDTRPEYFDRVVVAASIHMGGYQRAVARWVRRHAAALNRIPSAFISVCLGILEQRAEAQREVRAIPERFFQRSGWLPTATKIVAGAVPYTRYGWLKKLIMKRIAAKAGGDTDTTRDFEYTNWDELRSFVREFALHEGTFAPSSPSSDLRMARL